MAVDEFGLTPKQRAWCDYYIETGNGTEAARRAGYKYPEQGSRDNTQKQSCKSYIAERMKPRNDARIASADEVLQYLTRVMLGQEKDQFGLDASLQDRTKAAQELLKRYAVADQRQSATMQRLDSMMLEFRAAIAQPAPTQEATPEEPATGPDSV